MLSDCDDRTPVAVTNGPLPGSARISDYDATSAVIAFFCHGASLHIESSPMSAVGQVPVPDLQDLP